MEIIEKAGGYGLIKPVEGVLTSPFGERVNPITGKNEYHNGIDVACEEGTPVLAAAQGTVIGTGVSETFGVYVKYSVSEEYSIFYAHLKKALVKEGDALTKGQITAESGNTGRSTGPHLHITVYKDGVEVDPLSYFNY